MSNQNEQKFSTDWSAIRAAFEAGDDSSRSIAKAFGVTEGAIRKRAKTENWKRTAGTRSDTHSPAYRRVRTDRDCSKDARESTSTPADDARLRSAELAVDSSPEDLSALRGLGFQVIADLTRELAVLSKNVGLIEAIIEEETRGDKSPRRRDMLLKAISNPARMAAVKNMAAAFDILYGAGPGKKAQAMADAKNVGGDQSMWGNDLDPHASDRGKPN